MTGMDEIVSLRRAGLRPSAVFVDLVAEAPSDEFVLSACGVVEVAIGRADRLSEIDFRPLVGLRVHISDFTGDRQRHRRAAAMVAAVEPSHLVMPVWEGDTLAVHQRWAGSPARTETFRV